MVEQDVGVAAQGYVQYFTTICMLVVTFGLVLMAHERIERQYVVSSGPGRATD